MNFTHRQDVPLTLSEKLLSATSFVEGWAHYDEQMMVDEGWGNGHRVFGYCSCARRFGATRATWPASRCTRGDDGRARIELFEDQAFLDPADARAEAKRGTQDATYGYYTFGKLAILKLRADYKKKLGASSPWPASTTSAAVRRSGDPVLAPAAPRQRRRRQDPLMSRKERRKGRAGSRRAGGCHTLAT